MSFGVMSIWEDGGVGSGSSLMPMRIWYHDLYTSGIHHDSRFPRERYRMLKSLIQRSKDSDLIDFVAPACASVEDLMMVHDADFVRRFVEGELDDREINRIGLKPWTDSFVERTLRILEIWREAPITHMWTLDRAIASSTILRSVLLSLLGLWGFPAWQFSILMSIREMGQRPC